MESIGRSAPDPQGREQPGTREQTAREGRAGIGSNLNRIARWANSRATPTDAVEIIVHLIAVEREIARLARVGGERQDARGPSR